MERTHGTHCTRSTHGTQHAQFAALQAPCLLVVMVVVLAVVMCACANVGSPSGGPPDKTPPKIISTDPAPKSLNVHPRSVAFQFSKFMRKEQFAQHLFITPSVKTELSWSGKWLYVSFAESLDSNITVALTLGTQYTDWQGNKPESAFTLIFATGSKLDSGVIRGVLDNEKAEGVMMFLYPLNGINPDTLNPATTKPKYKTQVGAKGDFEFQALAAGMYRVFAVRDEYRDDLIAHGGTQNDAVGCAPFDIRVSAASQTSVSTSGTVKSSIANSSTVTAKPDAKPDMKPDIVLRIATAADRMAPTVFEAQSLSARRVRVKFSEQLRAESVTAASFVVSDSASGMPANARVQAAHVSVANPAFAELYLDRPLENPQSRWRVQAAVRDSAGNAGYETPALDSASTAIFTASQELDTLATRLAAVLLKHPTFQAGQIALKDSIQNVPLNASIDLVFTTAITLPMDTVAVKAACSIAMTQTLTVSAATSATVQKSTSTTTQSVGVAGVVATSGLVPFRVRTKAANILSLEPLKLFANNTPYTLTLNLPALKAWNGEPFGDSVLAVRFQTEDARGYGGVSGVLADVTDSSRMPLLLRPTGKYVILLESKEAVAKRTFQHVLSAPGAWEFPEVPPGAYKLSAFYDTNGNGRYDAGNPFPFVAAERFAVFAGEISIRPRWTVDSVRLAFP